MGTIDQEIGSRLKNFRKLNAQSQQQFCEILGLSRSMYAGFERGDHKFHAELILKICKECQCSADYLFFGTDEPEWQLGEDSEFKLPMRMHYQLDALPNSFLVELLKCIK